MESTLTRNEKVFITIGLSIVVAFLVTFSKLNKKPTDLSQYATSEAINYQMVRAEEGFSGYSLDGREIDDQYQGLKSKKINQTAKLLKPVSKLPTKAAVKAIAAGNKATQQNATVTATSAKPNNLNATSAQAVAKSTSANSPNEQSLAPQSQPTAQNTDPAAAAQNDSAKAKAKVKKTYAEWRQEIFAKASKEAVTDFIAAYRRNELTETEYQAMAQELIEQPDANLKGLGLMALRSQPSMASLSQLVRVAETAAAPLQTYIDQAFLAYVQPQNVQYLNQALQTQDRKLILKSLSLLSVNIPKIKSGDASILTDSRHLRGNETTDVTLGSFQQLLPSLNLIGSAQVPEISPLAVQVAALIKTAQVAGM